MLFLLAVSHIPDVLGITVGVEMLATKRAEVARDFRLTIEAFTHNSS